AGAGVSDRATPLVDAAALSPIVAFEDVSFSYPGGRRAAHEGLTFEVKAGERVGIVGPSGAGKSTVARLLLRFYDPDRGRVTIGGPVIRDRTLDPTPRPTPRLRPATHLFP